MSTFIDKLTTLTIAANGGSAQESEALNFRKYAHDAVAIGLQAPDTLDGTTYTILVSMDGGVTYNTLQFRKSDGTLGDYPVPAATKSVSIPVADLGGVTHLKIKSAASTVERIFTLSKTWC